MAPRSGFSISHSDARHVLCRIQSLARTRKRTRQRRESDSDEDEDFEDDDEDFEECTKDAPFPLVSVCQIRSTRE